MKANFASNSTTIEVAHQILSLTHLTLSLTRHSDARSQWNIFSDNRNIVPIMDVLAYLKLARDEW